MVLKFPFFYSGLLLQADAQPYHLSPSGVQQVNEGGSFVFDCTVETGMTPPFDVFLSYSTLTDRLSRVRILMGARYTFGPATSGDSGSMLRCASANVFTVESATLDLDVTVSATLVCDLYSLPEQRGDNQGSVITIGNSRNALVIAAKGVLTETVRQSNR